MEHPLLKLLGIEELLRNATVMLRPYISAEALRVAYWAILLSYGNLFFLHASQLWMARSHRRRQWMAPIWPIIVLALLTANLHLRIAIGR